MRTSVTGRRLGQGLGIHEAGVAAQVAGVYAAGGVAEARC